MNEQEIGSMIIRLLGDGSVYQEMLKQAQSATKEATDKIEKNTTQIAGFSKSIQGFAETAVTALTALGAKDFLKQSFDLFVQAESGQMRLKAAIEAGGHAVDATLDSYKEFSNTLRESTGTSISQSTHLLQMAESYGMSGAQARKAVEASIGLAAALGGEASHYIMVTKAIEEGNAHMLHRIPALRGIHDQSEKLAKAQDLVNKSLGVAAAMSNTTEGIMKRFNNTLGDMRRQFGSVVAEGVRPVVVWLTQLVKLFTDLDEDTRRIVVVFAGLVAGILAIGPAIAGVVKGWALLSPLILTSFSTIGAFLGLLAAPLATLATLASGIAVFFSGWTIPLIAVGVVITALVALAINRLGGIKATWELVRDALMKGWEIVKAFAVVAWERTQKAAQDFWLWIKPTVDLLVKWFDIAWRSVWHAGEIAWDYLKTKVTDFVTWFVPRFLIVKDFLLKLWDEATKVALKFWDWLKARVADFVEWAKPKFYAIVNLLISLWVNAREAAIQAWDYTKGRVQDFLEWFKPKFKAGMDWLAETWNWVYEKTAETWDFLRRKINQFIDWMTPIVVAAVGILVALWDVLSATAIETWNLFSTGAVVAWGLVSAAGEKTWNFLKLAFEGFTFFVERQWGIIFSNTSLTWAGIQATIIDALILCEYMIRNFGLIAGHTWLVIQLKFVILVDYIQGWFSNMIPNLLSTFTGMWRITFDWIVTNWRLTFTGMFGIARFVFNQIVDNAVAIFANLPDLIAGNKGFKDVWTGLGKDASISLLDALKLPTEATKSLRAELEKQVKEQGAMIDMDMAEFFKKRRDEINKFRIGSLFDTNNPFSGFDWKLPEWDWKKMFVDPAKHAGDEAGAGMAKSFKASAKFDAVLKDSAEALFRISAFKDKLAGTAPGARPGAGGTGAASTGQEAGGANALGVFNSFKDWLKGTAPTVAGVGGAGGVATNPMGVLGAGGIGGHTAVPKPPAFIDEMKDAIPDMADIKNVIEEARKQLPKLLEVGEAERRLNDQIKEWEKNIPKPVPMPGGWGLPPAAVTNANGAENGLGGGNDKVVALLGKMVDYLDTIANNPPPIETTSVGLV